MIKKFYLKLLMSLLLTALAVPLAQADELTVAGDNATATSDYTVVPLYGQYMDTDGTYSQIIYSKSLLSALNGNKITSVKFYADRNLSSQNDVVVEVSLMETDYDAFSSSTPTPLTGFPSALGSYTISGSPSELEIPLTNEFIYSGNKNLAVQVKVVGSKTSAFSTIYWYGESTTNAVAYYYYQAYSTQQGTKSYLPKTTFTYEAAGGSVSVNPTSLDFNESDTYVGGSYQKTFTVTNSTEDAVTITQTGDNVFTFSPATVAAGATETITVTYAPTAVGTNNATLAVGDKSVTLTGTAVAAPAPTITVNPATVTINTQPYTAGAASFTVTGTNLTGDITLSFEGSSLFAVNPSTITSAEAANGKAVTVTYSAQEVGTFNGTVTLTSAGAETVTVPVTANVVTPVISGTVTPTTLTLTCQEGATTTGTITVENTGNTAFTPAFSTLTAPFSIEAATEIAAGESKQFTVTYAPSLYGNHSATLTVTINGQATNVTLNGTATEAPEGGELTVAESTSTSAANLSSIAPIYGGKYDQTGWVQMLYPASLITDLNGKQITKVTFRHNGKPYFSGGAVEVKIGETDNSDLSSRVAESTLTAVATVSPIGNAFDNSYYLTFEFTTPYVYNGGNLVIQTKVTTKGSEDRSKFYGKTTSQLGLGDITTLATSYSANTGDGYSTSFLPQATFTYEKVAGVVVEPTDGTLAFGEVSITGSKNLFVTVTNKNSVAVPLSVTNPESPFSFPYTDTEIPANSTIQFPVHFAPTEGIDYTGSLTMTINNVDYVFTLTGTGHVNEPTMGEDDFAAITYDWTDSNGDEHKDTPMNQPATTPEQMIALMKAVYTNPNVPGNIYRGYTAAGEHETDLVSYPAIGTMSNYAYSDSYGWNIPAKSDVVKVGSSYYLNPTDYLPNKEGLTVLLVEMNDQKVAEAKATEYGLPTTISGESTYQSTSSYTDLVQKFDVMFKSVRVLTSSKNIGAGETGGTLFKIDCDKMNRFFLLGKGRLRAYYSDNVKMPDGNGNSYQVVDNDDVTKAPFYRMFEEFSPNVASVGTSAETDIYQKLVNMESYSVIHDCVSVPTIDGHHEFNLYGVESPSDDCQDVRDMMLFIPERRMTQWSDNSLSSGENKRDNSDVDHYVNYYQNNAPKLGLFVIKQYPIDGVQVDGQDVYKLHLTWTSNLLDFLPGEDGQYTLYRVVTNADGSKTYTPVVENLDPNTFEYDDYIDMQQNGQQITYVVRGQDKEQFLTLQMSNEESFIIPGLDKAEQLQLVLNADHYYSRFYPQTAKNYYSNRFYIKNNIGTNVKAKYLENGTTFTFYRVPDVGGVTENVEDYVAQNRVAFATATVASKDNGTGTLTIAPITSNADYWDGTEYVFGYKAPATSATFSYDVADENSDVLFNDLKIIDNFWVNVEGNTHPNNYGYYVELETAVPFTLDETSGVPTIATEQDGIYAYFEIPQSYNANIVRAWAWIKNQDGTETNLTGSTWPGTATMTKVGTNGNNDVYRWIADETIQQQPTHILFNWNDANDMQKSANFEFTNGGYYNNTTAGGYVGASNGSTAARSNSILISTHKTAMTASEYSWEDVEGDTQHKLQLANEFDITVKQSSKSEILGYYAYRWDSSYGTEEKPYAIITGTADNEEDISPNGQASNQGEYYTVAMNKDYTSQVDFNGTTTAQAPFIDNHIKDNADVYTYAPVVEVFAPSAAVNEDGTDRKDYNTYGASLTNLASAKIEVDVEKYANVGENGYEWTDGTNTYTYYQVQLKVNVLDLPTGYQIAKVRTWRKIDKDYLGEQNPTQYTADYRWRIDNIDAETGELLYIDKEDCQLNEALGDKPDNNGIFAGTFGALKLETGDEIPMEFVVRIYFTKEDSGSKAVESADGKYYIAEVTATDKLTSDIPTSIYGVESAKVVAGVKYYNMAGVESDVPFQGINIEVTTYKDGSRTSRKIMK